MNKKILVLILFAILVGISGCAPKPQQEQIECRDYNVSSCPEECSICPPCAECSSVSCQTEGFCNSIGFEKRWYQENQERQRWVLKK
ncbi:MAG: hypothetical protein KJ574_04650 [Nanoarchaeota archaeon]|nr:hypothetical protein [Nanoarchaeota archaeon]